MISPSGRSLPHRLMRTRNSSGGTSTRSTIHTHTSSYSRKAASADTAIAAHVRGRFNKPLTVVLLGERRSLPQPNPRGVVPRPDHGTGACPTRGELHPVIRRHRGGIGQARMAPALRLTGKGVALTKSLAATRSGA